MASIISTSDLASYLETTATPAFDLKVELANGIVSELPYSDGVPSPVPMRMKAITLEVAARGIRNSEGYSSETIDDYTYRRAEGTREAGVYLTPAEREELLGFGSTRPRGSFYTVGMVSPLDVQ